MYIYISDHICILCICIYCLGVRLHLQLFTNLQHLYEDFPIQVPILGNFPMFEDTEWQPPENFHRVFPLAPTTEESTCP